MSEENIIYRIADSDEFAGIGLDVEEFERIARRFIKIGKRIGYNEALEDKLREIIDLYDSGITGLEIRKHCVEILGELKSEGEENEE